MVHACGVGVCGQHHAEPHMPPRPAASWSQAKQADASLLSKHARSTSMCTNNARLGATKTQRTDKQRHDDFLFCIIERTDLLQQMFAVCLTSDFVHACARTARTYDVNCVSHDIDVHRVFVGIHAGLAPATPKLTTIMKQNT